MPDPGLPEVVWYESTSAQQGLWVLDRVERLRPSYLLPSVIRFAGPIEHEVLADAVRQSLARHPALRSRFRLDHGLRRVRYRTDGPPPDAGFLDAHAEGWSADDLALLVDALCYTPFDLGEEAPARAEVIRVDPDTTLLVLTVHHIVFDGVSRRVLVDEIVGRYRAAVLGERFDPPAAVHPAQVLDTRPQAELDERVTEVVDRLRGAPTDVELPYDGDPNAPDLSMIGAGASTWLDAGLTGKLLEVAAAEGGTAFMVGVTILAGTLARMTKQRDFLFAVVWPGRQNPDTQDAVGMFMSTLVLRVRLDADTTWRQLLRTARIGGMEAFIDCDVPLDAIVGALDHDRDVSRPPLTPVLVNMAEVPGVVELVPGVVGTYQPLHPQYSKWDLALFVHLADSDTGQRMELSLDYPAALFTDATITEFLAALTDSATDLALSSEETVQQPASNKTDLDDPAARLELVRSVWCEVLAAEEIGDEVSFFDAGGDSLRLVILAERLGQESGRDLRTVDLFRAGTVRGQADLLATDTGNTREAASGAVPGGAASSRERLLASVRNRRGTQQG